MAKQINTSSNAHSPEEKINVQLAVELAQAPDEYDMRNSDLRWRIGLLQRNPQRWGKICVMAQELDITPQRSIALYLEILEASITPWANVPQMNQGHNALWTPIDNLDVAQEHRLQLMQTWYLVGARIKESEGEYKDASDFYQPVIDLNLSDISRLYAEFMLIRSTILDRIVNYNTVSDLLRMLNTARVNLKKQATRQERNWEYVLLKTSLCKTQVHILEQDIHDQSHQSALRAANECEIPAVRTAFNARILLADAVVCMQQHMDRQNERNVNKKQTAVRFAESALQMSGGYGDLAADALLLLWHIHVHERENQLAEAMANHIMALKGRYPIPKQIASKYLDLRSKAS